MANISGASFTNILPAGADRPGSFISNYGAEKKQSRFEKLVYGFITLQQMNGIDKWNVII